MTMPKPPIQKPSPKPPAPPGVPPAFLAGPSWAANAIIAAEVFGPPLALRPR
jgi:hypothetical protein